MPRGTKRDYRKHTRIEAHKGAAWLWPYAKAVDVKLLKKDIEKLTYAGLDFGHLMR